MTTETGMLWNGSISTTTTNAGSVSIGPTILGVSGSDAGKVGLSIGFKTNDKTTMTGGMTVGIDGIHFTGETKVVIKSTDIGNGVTEEQFESSNSQIGISTWGLAFMLYGGAFAGEIGAAASGAGALVPALA